MRYAKDRIKTYKEKHIERSSITVPLPIKVRFQNMADLHKDKTGEFQYKFLEELLNFYENNRTT